MNDLEGSYKIQKERFEQLKQKLNRDTLLQELRPLEASALKNDFWQDITKATETMQKIADLKAEVKQLDELEKQSETLGELVSLSSAESSGLDIANELRLFERNLNQVEVRLFLHEKYDKSSCFLSVHSGQGGVEAMDWAAMILRMYQRYCERKGWKVTLIDETKGEEAGIKSATLEIVGSFTYGLLKKESGTHRLVRLSPFNGDNLRQTSFALVEVLPVIEDSSEIEIKESDLEWDAFRSSGPGGQNVQKVSTAVRVKHLPTGITVTCQTERSQFQNKENALKILKAKVYQIELEKRRAEEKTLKDWQKTASWGTQIRSYVLHPYKLVKDLRTNVETSAAEEVLDGDLDQFIDAEIRID